MWIKKTQILTTISVILCATIASISIMPTEIATADLQFAYNIPLVFVDPQNATANVGQTVTVAVKIFNLTDAFYGTNTEWQDGDEELGPSGGILFNYSLGKLYGFDIKFSWNPNILEYVSHTVKVPRGDTHPDGTLHAPIQEIVDVANAAAGTYWLAKSSLDPAPVFNTPNANATVFTMTFEVLKKGISRLRLDSVDLSTRKSQGDDHRQMIPRVVKSGEFKTPLLATSVENLEVEAQANGDTFTLPIISGEDGVAHATLRNDNLTFSDTYNLTLFYDDIALDDGVWRNRTLNPQETEILNYTFAAEDLAVGAHTLRTAARILHAGDILTDEASISFDVIATPVLSVTGPSGVSAGQSASFDASQSTHSDPSGTIQNYSWAFYAPGETLAKFSYVGESITHTFATTAKNGTWRVVLTVKDSFGVTYNEDRAATAPYRTEVTLEVGAVGPPSFFNLENIALIVVLIVIIIAAVLYLRRRSR